MLFSPLNGKRKPILPLPAILEFRPRATLSPVVSAVTIYRGFNTRSIRRNWAVLPR